MCLFYDYVYGLMTGLFVWISLTSLSRTYFIILKVKLRSHNFRCNISMNNCLIAFTFCTEVQSE